MAPKYDPWNPGNSHRNPRNDAPAFQREWVPLASSGVLVDNETTQTIVEAPSSTAASGTIYLWGVAFCTADAAANGGTLEDEDGKKYCGAVGTAQGPFFWSLDTPIAITQNSKLIYRKIVYKANSYITPLYTVMHEPPGVAE
tara:strand:+ start:213 stop:638 length:426 start_codon:yes stop_codon:yes gene_type:complete